MVSSLFSIRFDRPEITTAVESLRGSDRLSGYLAGPENALLEPVARSVFTACHRFSPIFVFGPPAVGKSYLLDGLAAAYCKLHATRRVVQLSGADFARSLATALEVDGLADVRRTHRNCGLFIVDDIEELTGKTRAQHELLHTLDVLAQRGTLVLVAARVGVGELPLIGGLRSRLAGGLTVALRLPAPATRRQLLRQLADELEIELSDDLLAQLTDAGQPSGHLSVPALRGLLLQLRTTLADPSPEHPVAISPSMMHGSDMVSATPRRIIQQVARHFSLKSADLKGASRRQTTVLARGLAIYLIRRLNGSSFEQIGRLFGDRDHTTVLHAFRRIDQKKHDPTVELALRELTHKLGVPAFD